MAITHGADTDQLRDQAGRSERCARTLLERSAALDAAVRAVTWEGTDAAAFQDRWGQVHRDWQALAGTLLTHGRELHTHAQEQDRTSAPSADGQSAGGGAAPATGPGPGGVPGAVGAGVSAGLGLGALGPAGFAPTSLDIDDFGHERGDDSGETSATITLPDGTEIQLSEDGETRTVSLDVPVGYEQTIDAGGVEITQKVTVGTEFEVRLNEDGSVTYTFTGTSEQTTGAGIDSRNVDAEGKHSVSTESLYSVTVPEGTSLEDALRINPFNPGSIPEQGSITVGSGIEQSSSLEVSGRYRGLEVGLGIERTSGTETNTVITRDENGILSLSTGPTTMVGDGSSLSIGVPGAALKFGTSRTQEHGVVEFAAFSDDAAGNQAYMQALLSDGYPSDATAPGVVDRYTQTHTSTSMEFSVGFEIEDVFDLSHSQNTFADELIVREYPDGSNEWIQQVLPHGEGADNSVLVSGGTGRETDYTMTLGDVPAGNGEGIYQAYWGTPHTGGDLEVSFTQEELALMAENRALWHGNPDQYENETDYLSAVVATASGQDGSMVMEDLYRDYNLRPQYANDRITAEQVHPEYTAPGRIH